MLTIKPLDMKKNTIYKGHEITFNLSGWYSSFSPSKGYLKADTLQGIKKLINSTIAEEQEAERAFFKSHPELNP